jgi:hypothetical protein
MAPRGGARSAMPMRPADVRPRRRERHADRPASRPRRRCVRPPRRDHGTVGPIPAAGAA